MLLSDFAVDAWIPLESHPVAGACPRTRPYGRAAGLQLIGDIAPQAVRWSYVLVDEARRCFAARPPGALAARVAERLLRGALQGVEWKQPRGRGGPSPGRPRGR